MKDLSFFPDAEHGEHSFCIDQITAMSACPLFQTDHIIIHYFNIHLHSFY